MARRLARRLARPSALALGLLLSLPATGCGEDEIKTTGQRGLGGSKKKKKSDAGGKAQPTSRRQTDGAAAGEVMTEAPPEDPTPKRPPPKLEATTFTKLRDPFQGFVAAEPVQPEPDPIRAEREVQLRQYSFEDLKLVAIANSRRPSVRPRALFVAGDGISGAVRQGEYFSSAEVLLVAVNRDYVEIEVVDEVLAESLGMKRGERRSMYLRKE